MIFRRKQQAGGHGGADGYGGDDGVAAADSTDPGFGNGLVDAGLVDTDYGNTDYVDAEYAEHLTADGSFVAGGVESSTAGLDPLAELGQLRDERQALIELCLYARDRVNSKAAAERIDAGLRDLGITALRPDGQPFDPAQHEAAASVPTSDADLHGTVAETEVPGYADRGRVVRPPVVAVYRREPL